MIAANSPMLLSCHQLTKRFGGLLALDRFDLDVPHGGITGVIGPNGSGKTTLFNVITGIFPASSGTIAYGGADLTNKSPQQVCYAGISRTFQRSRLCLGLSIFDNLMIGNHIRLHHGIWPNLFNRQALRRELDEMIDRARGLMMVFDPKLAHRMDEQVGSQSMIDRRRIEICRALISEPKLLLLDEPSAGMTETETRQLMDNLLKMKGHMGALTIIIIEHEMNVIERITNHCVVLNFGRKICEGAYAEVVKNPEVQSAYLGDRTKEGKKRERRTRH
jgi:branched-chain amino acid transport system ATP-binding protein